MFIVTHELQDQATQAGTTITLPGVWGANNSDIKAD